MTGKPTIPFNRTAAEGRELEYLRESIEGGHSSSFGPFSKRVGAILKEETGADVLLTTSCTSALELSAMLLKLGPEDTVVVPSFTFTTSALAFARQGARILFCDIEPDTLGLDPKHLAELLDDTVKAVVIVHYAGIACDVGGIKAVLADRPDISLVEDAAHGLFGKWRGEPLGSLGRFASLSFHETKNFVCGEGGALLLNDPSDLAPARIYYDKGTDRQAFFLGQVDKYSWRDTGSSFGLSDTLAAYLLAQLEQADSIQARRRHVFESYLEGLGRDAAELGYRLPIIPDDCDPAYHLFYVLMPDHATRTRVMELMREDGVQTTFHYVPLHDSDGGRRFAARHVECPVTTDVSGRLMRLPFFNNLSDDELERVMTSFLSATRSAISGGAQ